MDRCIFTVGLVIMLAVCSLFVAALPSVRADTVPSSYEVTLIDQNYSLLGAIPNNVILGNNQGYSTNSSMFYNSSAGAIEYTTIGDQVGSVYVGIEPFINGNISISLKVSSDNWNSNVYILGSTFWLQTQTLNDGGARVTSFYDTSATTFASSFYEVPVSALDDGVNTINIAISGTTKSLRVYYNDTIGVNTPMYDWTVQQLPYEPTTLPIIRFDNEVSSLATWVSTGLYAIKETVSGGLVSSIPGNDFVPFGIDYPRESYNLMGTQYMTSHGQKGVAWVDIGWLPDQKDYIDSLLAAGWELGIHYNVGLANLPLDQALTTMRDQYDQITTMFGTAPTTWCSYQNVDNVTHATYAFEQLGMRWRNGYSGISYISNVGNLQETRWTEFWSNISNAQMVYPSFTHKTDEAIAEAYAIGYENFTNWVDNYDGKQIIGFNEYYNRIANQVDTTVHYITYVEGEQLKFSVDCNAFPTRLMIDFASAQNAVVLKNGASLSEGTDYTIVGGDSIILFGSSNDEFEVIIPSVPEAPSGLNATASSTQVQLSWNAPTNNRGAVIDYYVIYQNGLDVAHVTETSMTMTGLSNGVTYDFAIAAHNSAGLGMVSANVSATPSASVTTPGPPTLLTATPGESQVHLSWMAPIEDGGSHIDYYVIYQNGVSVDSVNGTTKTVNDLVNGVSYLFQVAAHNNAGNGPFSNVVSVTPSTSVIGPSAPTNLTVTVKEYTVELTWDEPLDPGGSPIIEYRIYRGTSSSAMELIATVNGTSYIDNNLASGVKYYYGVFAVNGNGMSLNPSLVDATISASPVNDPYQPVPIEYIAVLGAEVAVIVGVGAYLLLRRRSAS